ncbi:MAG: hypothetical protein K6G26_03045, partial [Lachnospiraceae bacterium]|nr:hypothetical protein [Lachnospiraceae bacterium]
MFSDLKGIQKSKMFITSISLIILGILIFLANSESEIPVKQDSTTYATIEPVDNSDSNFKENTITKDKVNFLYYKDNMMVAKNEDMALTIRNVVAYDKKIVVHYEVETKSNNSMVIPTLELYVNDIKCKESKSNLSKCTSKGFNNYDDSRMLEVIYKSNNEVKPGDEICLKLDKLETECELVPYDELDGNLLVHNDVAFVTKPYAKGNYLSIDVVLVNYSCFKDIYLPANSVQIGHERNYIIINNKKLRTITNLKDIRQSTLERTWYVEFDISDID